MDYLAALHQTAGYSNGGTAQKSLLQPKASLIFTPTDYLEFYASAGQGFHSADLRGVNQDRSVDLGLPHTSLLAKQDGQEVGFRAEIQRNIALTFAVFNLWQSSETIIDPDVGMDTAGPPSRRYGYEVNITYQINPHLEFYGSYSGDHTRFTHSLDDGTGHLGRFHHRRSGGNRFGRVVPHQLGPTQRWPERTILGQLSTILRSLRGFRGRT